MVETPLIPKSQTLLKPTIETFRGRGYGKFPAVKAGRNLIIKGEVFWANLECFLALITGGHLGKYSGVLLLFQITLSK